MSMDGGGTTSGGRALSIEADGLRMHYGTTDTLHDVTFQVGAGEVVALLGCVVRRWRTPTFPWYAGETRAASRPFLGLDRATAVRHHRWRPRQSRAVAGADAGHAALPARPHTRPDHPRHEHGDGHGVDEPAPDGRPRGRHPAAAAGHAVRDRGSSVREVDLGFRGARAGSGALPGTRVVPGRRARRGAGRDVGAAHRRTWPGVQHHNRCEVAAGTIDECCNVWISARCRTRKRPTTWPAGSPSVRRAPSPTGCSC